MSAETSQWLNQHTLIGLTAQRGTAWHYRKSDQGSEPNHYDGFVPVEDVERRLFNWTPGEREVAIVVKGLRDDALTSYVADDGLVYSVVSAPGRKAITRDDDDTVLGIFTDNYQPHSYREALLDNVGAILSTANGDLGIGSAGLLRKGGQAWVQVQVPETVEVGGTLLLPYLTAATSLDGSMATTYLVGTDVVVCDNTLTAATVSARNRIKLRHSRYSTLRLGEARDELEILFAATDDMVEAIDRLQNITVTDADFAKVRESLDPRPETEASPALQTRWDNRQEKLIKLWISDDRVAPWRGTAWGTLMAYNTFVQHEQSYRKTKLTGHRAERNMVGTIQGRMEAEDARVLKALSEVLDQPMVLA